MKHWSWRRFFSSAHVWRKVVFIINKAPTSFSFHCVGAFNSNYFQPAAQPPSERSVSILLGAMNDNRPGRLKGTVSSYSLDRRAPRAHGSNSVCLQLCVCLQGGGEILSLTPCPDLEVDRLVFGGTDKGILKEPHRYTASIRGYCRRQSDKELWKSSFISCLMSSALQLSVFYF